jgi:UDP-glucose 4-epimerase
VLVSDDLVLVTGGAGFIGANLARRLLKAGRRVRVVDDFSVGRRDYLRGLGLEILEADLHDPAVVDRALIGVSHVVHLAAATSVLESVSDPVAGARLNVQSLVALLDAASRRGLRRFVFASSNAAVGDVTPPVSETQLPCPTSPYGASKLAGEAYCWAFSATRALPTAVLRFANAYGEYSWHKKSAIHRFLQLLLRGEPITIYGDGCQTRDFVHVDDVCAAIELSLYRPLTSPLFQIGTGRETSVNELIHLLARVTGKMVHVEHRPSNPGEIKRSYCDITRARRVLGYEPMVSLADGLDRTYRWYLEEMAGVGGVDVSHVEGA